MKTIEIIGKNYSGKYTCCRTACRGVIIDNDNILLSYGTKIDQWMTPGGGVEKDESVVDCCVRELAEETGKIVKFGDCVLQIDEYYGNDKFVNKYFVGKCVGNTARRLTVQEKYIGLEPRWIPLKKALDIFGQYELYAQSNEITRGLYFREYTALCEIAKAITK